MNIHFYPSTKAGKKYTVYITDCPAFGCRSPGEIKHHTIHFGDSKYLDYTQHHDKERRNRYIERHQTREDWQNYRTPGFWARWVLWNQPTIYEGLTEISQYLNAPIYWHKKNGIVVIT